MQDIKRAARELTTRGKAGMREADGHSLSDDVGNAGDRVREAYGNAKDEAQDEQKKSRARTEHERSGRRAQP